MKALTLKAATNWLLGNPLRDLEETDRAVAKVLRSKSAPEWLKEYAIIISNDAYVLRAETVDEHNARVVATECVHD